MFHISLLPAVISAICLTVYWIAVVVKLVSLGRKIGKSPNAVPRERVGQLMRIIWYPTIILQILHVWMVVSNANWGFLLLKRFNELPFAIDNAPLMWIALAWLSAIVVVLCTFLTFICWNSMGRSWRIGIDPREKLDLVSTGPYRYVRHPIYALRILLDVCAIVTIPTFFMATVTFSDILLLQIEARREEQYMESKHGKIYSSYKEKVGRFMPKLSALYNNPN